MESVVLDYRELAHRSIGASTGKSLKNLLPNTLVIMPEEKKANTTTGRRSYIRISRLHIKGALGKDFIEEWV